MKTLVSLSIGFLLVGAVCWTLERLRPAHSKQPLWRRDSWLDLAYWFFTPLVSKTVSKVGVGVVVVILALLLGMKLDLQHLKAEASKLVAGFGPLSRQPLWLQAVEILVLGDFISYWMHRAFHRGRLWPFHAVHHGSTQVDWLSSVRLHPVNELLTRVAQVIPLFALGFKPTVLAAYVPFLTFYALVLHANVPWDFGPLRAVIASPVFHRWHHTRETEAMNKNFAGFFPAWDLLFGTYYMPRGKQPTDFGIHDPMPATLLGQMLHPFRQTRQP